MKNSLVIAGALLVLGLAALFGFYALGGNHPTVVASDYRGVPVGYVVNPPYYAAYHVSAPVAYRTVRREVVVVPPPPAVSPPDNDPVFCTMDAKMCPDGSYVGRVAPRCDFAMCPST